MKSALWHTLKILTSDSGKMIWTQSQIRFLAQNFKRKSETSMIATPSCVTLGTPQVAQLDVTIMAASIATEKTIMWVIVINEFQ